MKAKFAYISATNPHEDFIFYLNAESEGEAYQIVDDLNATLSTAHVEFINFD